MERIGNVHTCVGVVVTDTVGDVRVEVSYVNCVWSSPGNKLMGAVVGPNVFSVGWRV